MHGESLVKLVFSSEKVDERTNRMLANTRSAAAAGVLIFEESDEYVYVLSNNFPSSGQLRALVADRLKSDFKKAIEATGLRPDITRSSFTGWSECRGLTAEALRRVNLASFPSLLRVRSLRRTLPPPEIKIRGGIQSGAGFIALPNGLPHMEISEAESVSIEVAEGNWVMLDRVEGAEDCWRFGATLSPERLLGTHRIVAFSASVPIAEQEITFIENVFTADYKQPQEPVPLAG